MFFFSLVLDFEGESCLKDFIMKYYSHSRGVCGELMHFNDAYQGEFSQILKIRDETAVVVCFKQENLTWTDSK